MLVDEMEMEDGMLHDTVVEIEGATAEQQAAEDESATVR